jgi:hypothetical protein
LQFQKGIIPGGGKGSEGSEGSEGGSEALKLKGFNLKVKLKLKLKCLRVFQRVVFQRVEFQRVEWYLTGSQG